MRVAGERVAAAPLAAFALVAVAAAIRIGLAQQNVTPWIFVDELLHSELAKSVAGGDGFAARGQGSRSATSTRCSSLRPGGSAR